MSYCVNCGVKLAKSEKKCPLCNTKIINPNIVKEEYVPAYASQIEKFNSINIKFIAKLSITVFLLLAAITMLCDLIITKSISWSLYVLFAIVYIITHFIFAFSKNIYFSFFLLLISTESLLFLIAYLNK